MAVTKTLKIKNLCGINEGS